MTISQAKIAESRPVGAKPIGDDGVRHVSLPFQQSAQEFEGRLPVTPWLNDDVENFALVVDGAPEIVGLAADPDEDSSRCQRPEGRGRRCRIRAA